MKHILAFLLLCSTATGATFNAWVTEEWKLSVTDWTVLVHDSAGALAGKQTGITATDLGANSGANVQGTIDTSGTLNQWVTVAFIDTATNYAATTKAHYLDGTGSIIAAPPADLTTGGTADTKLDNIYVDTQGIGADTDAIIATQANHTTSLNTIETNTDAIIATQATHTTSLGNIYTDTQALQPLLSGVDVITILGSDPLAQIGVGTWNALTANHNVAGSFGELMQNIGGGTDPVAIAQAVWAEVVASNQDAGSFGEMINNIWVTVQTLTNEADFAAPDNIANSRTLFISGSLATSIVELNAWTSGVVTIANDCDNTNTLNPGTTIASITSATVTPDAGGAAIATSDLRVQQNKRKCNFSVDPISTAGWYTARTVFVTSDGQTLTVQGKIEVR